MGPLGLPCFTAIAIHLASKQRPLKITNFFNSVFFLLLCSVYTISSLILSSLLYPVSLFTNSPSFPVTELTSAPPHVARLQHIVFESHIDLLPPLYINTRVTQLLPEQWSGSVWICTSVFRVSGSSSSLLLCLEPDGTGYKNQLELHLRGRGSLSQPTPPKAWAQDGSLTPSVASVHHLNTNPLQSLPPPTLTSLEHWESER